MTLIDSLEHYYGALDENDQKRPQESPQPVNEPFEELFNLDPDDELEDWEDLEADVDDYEDDELEKS